MSEDNEETIIDNNIPEVVKGKRIRPTGLKYKTHRNKEDPETKLGYKKTHRIVNLALKGMPDNEISEVYNVSVNTIRDITKEFRELIGSINEDTVRSYRDLKANILDMGHKKMLKSLLSDEKINAASFKDLAWGTESIFRQSRLEQNLSTDNRAISMVKAKRGY